MLQIKDVDLGYGRTTVVHGVNLVVPERSVVSVLGHNGAGKTTLLRGAVGLLKPKSGTILFEGEDISKLAPNKRVRRGIGYVAQGQQSFGELSTAENLQLVADGLSDGKARIDEALDLFPALGELMKRQAGLLSGGQRQQLAIARALIRRPKLLMLDEPTEGIQPSVVQQIERAILQLAQSGISVLLVEQHVGFALQACDSYVVLTSGRVGSAGEGGSAAASRVREAMAI